LKEVITKLKKEAHRRQRCIGENEPGGILFIKQFFVTRMLRNNPKSINQWVNKPINAKILLINFTRY